MFASLRREKIVPLGGAANVVSGTALPMPAPTLSVIPRAVPAIRKRRWGSVWASVLENQRSANGNVPASA